ncbi:MAG: hypothetical protein HXY20_00495 [Acidobacteria bacterium]|nr:hypothetical protein [Acidobacteriota bacterium]
MSGTVAFGIFLRAYNLDVPELWEDEAESSINALTILEHGYPVDHYLGLPIYENTLVKPWPESREYEFRDVSYSNKGLAVYHGWLPLYSIAASLRLFGITPDEAREIPRVLHGADQAALRTIAPRIPAIFYSLIFLVSLFFLTRSLHSNDAAWAAVIAASVMDGLVTFGRSARYYSATLALVMLSGLAIWRLRESRRPRDFAFAAAALILLFHTHVLSFCVMGLLFAGASLRFWRARTLIPKLALFSALLAAGTLPWIWLSGFPDTLAASPRAWPLLDMPADLLWFRRENLAFAVVAAAGLGCLASGMLLRARRFFEPFLAHRGGMLFLAAWVATSYIIFLLLIPAASFFPSRISLMTIAPGLILLCVALAALSRVVTRRFCAPLTVLLVLAVLIAADRIHLHTLHSAEPGGTFTDFVDVMSDWQFAPGTRIYADPNRHLILTYYSGIPIQSIAPVRKSFLDGMKNGLLIIETTSPGSALSIGWILEEARRTGSSLTREQACSLARQLDMVVVGRRLEGKVASVRPPVGELTLLEKNLAALQQRVTRAQIESLKRSAPIFRGYDFQHWSDWWPVFFYRFSHVERRWRDNLNYADRVRHSSALVLPWGWVVYDCTRGGSAVLDSRETMTRALEKATTLWEKRTSGAWLE